jgi:hypothetical protein
MQKKQTQPSPPSTPAAAELPATSTERNDDSNWRGDLERRLEAVEAFQVFFFFWFLFYMRPSNSLSQKYIQKIMSCSN